MPKPEFPFEAVREGDNIVLVALTDGPYAISEPKRTTLFTLTPDHVAALKRMSQEKK